MNLFQLIPNLPNYSILSPAGLSAQTALNNLQITGITSDSRQVQPGALFVAYRGVATDGHRYLADAAARGAAALVVETATHPQIEHLPPVIQVPNGREALAYLSAAWYKFPAQKLAMVGITGTDGKTTTTNFLYHILKTAGQNVGMITTVNAIIGERVLDTGLHTTTPDAPDVQRFLAEMVRSGTDTCLLETTSHGLAQHRVTACDFDIAVVTNITHEHLDIHGSLAGYRAAKASLFESLATAAQKHLPKTAVLNCDDWSFGFLRPKLDSAGVRWLGYSLTGHPQAAVTAANVACLPHKTTFTVRGQDFAFDAETNLVGDYNISNALAAITAAVAGLGVSPEDARAGVAALPGVPGRMERIDEGQPFTAIVDFAHTPNSLRRALAAAKLLTRGRVIAVFGCAGLRDVEKRTLMGEIAAELADFTVITAEDPRTESLAEIMARTAAAMTRCGGVEGQTFIREPDRGRAIFRAVQQARSGDILLALGKGHEQSMCFGSTEFPWDDRQALRAALRGQPLLTLPTRRSMTNGE